MKLPLFAPSSGSRSGFRRFLLPILSCLPLLAAGGANAQPTDTPAANVITLYTQCSFHPQGPGCPAAYQKALKDDSPDAAAVRDAFRYYARYLGTDNGGLTDADRQRLKQDGITLPKGLDAADLAGLHNVTNDPGLAADTRPAAVNNFLNRAVEAELYCGLNTCQNQTAAVS
jgi:hypothetical protein